MTSRSRSEPSLTGAVACSFLLHLIVAALIAIHTPARRARIFLPSAVSVSLVSPAQAGTKASGKAPAKAPAKVPAVEKEPPSGKKKVNIAPKKAEKKVESAKKTIDKPRRKPKGPTASDIMSRLREEVATQEKTVSQTASGTQGDVSVGGGGVSAVGAAIPYKLYLYELQSKIEEAWVKPKGIESGGEAQTIVSIRILRSGEVADVWIEEGSGNRFFDQSVVRAIRKSSPLPPLPPAVVGDSLEVGFRFFE